VGRSSVLSAGTASCTVWLLPQQNRNLAVKVPRFSGDGNFICSFCVVL